MAPENADEDHPAFGGPASDIYSLVHPPPPLKQNFAGAAPPDEAAPLVQSAFGLSCALPREHNSVHSSLAVGAASVLKPGTASALDLYWSRVSYTSSTVDDDVDVEGGGGGRGEGRPSGR